MVAAGTVLCVCTHNRTRSVLMKALLLSHSAHAGVDLVVNSAGTGTTGGAPTARTVSMLREIGIDMAAHRATSVDHSMVRAADLVLTADRSHVVELTARWPSAFAKTFVLPELVTRSVSTGGRLGRPFAEWLAVLGAQRPTGLAYLRDEVAAEGIDDPTGLTIERWEAAFRQVDRLMREVASLVS